MFSAVCWNICAGLNCIVVLNTLRIWLLYGVPTFWKVLECPANEKHALGCPGIVKKCPGKSWKLMIFRKLFNWNLEWWLLFHFFEIWNSLYIFREKCHGIYSKMSWKVLEINSEMSWKVLEMIQDIWVGTLYYNGLFLRDKGSAYTFKKVQNYITEM